MLVEDEHLPAPTEAEIRCTPWNEDATEQHPTGRPYVDAVATAAVDVSLGVALDTVRDTDFGVGKEAAVAEEWLAMVVLDVKSVTGSSHQHLRHMSRCRGVVTYMEDGLVNRHAPLPCTLSVSVTYSTLSSGEKHSPLGCPRPSATARMAPVAGSKR